MLKYNNIEQFRVEPGYINRTRIYLYPSIVLMKSYPQMRDLKDHFLCVSYAYDSLVIYYRRNNTVLLKSLINALKVNGEYVDSYLHNEDVYAVQVKPELNYASFEAGSYSDIYTKDQISKIFTKDGKTRKVLEKDPSYKEKYVNLINEWFNTHHTVKSLESRPNGKIVEINQYDIPPSMNQEVLNYEQKPTIKGGYIRSTES